MIRLVVSLRRSFLTAGDKPRSVRSDPKGQHLRCDATRPLWPYDRRVRSPVNGHPFASAYLRLCRHAAVQGSSLLTTRRWAIQLR